MKKNLFKSLFTVSAFTFLSRIMGLVRDVIFASIFGATAMMDAFSVAFRIPNLFRRFFGEGAFNQAFVPVFSEYKSKRTQDELKVFLANISGTLGFVLLVIAILGVFFSPYIVTLFAAGFEAGSKQFVLTNDLLKLMLPYLFFICMTAMYSSVLNALDRFAIPASIPIILNICLIIAAAFSVSFKEPILSLGYGVFVAGILQLGVAFYFVYRQNLVILPQINFRAPGVKRVMWLMLPALIASSSSQINILINTQLASRLQEGSITWLYYSDRLVEFAIGTFAVALGTVVLPRYSQLNVEKETQQLADTIDWGMRLALVVGIPAMLALYVLAEPLLALLFMRGAFTQYDVMMAGRSLTAYSWSIAAFFLIRVLVPIYFARQDTKTPVKFSLIAIATNICLQFILKDYFQHAGLAMASSVAAWVNAGLLIFSLKYSNIHDFKGIWRKETLIALLPANILLVVFLYWIQSFTSFWFEGALLGRIMILLLVIVVSVILYFGMVHICGMRLSSLREPTQENKKDFEGMDIDKD